MTCLFLAARRASMSYLPELHSDIDTNRWMRHTVLATNRVEVATEGEKIAGFSALNGGHLGHLYVDPAFQGIGVGSFLLERIQQSGLDAVTLYVFQRNTRARAFYERHGFRLAALRDGTRNEEKEPDALYEWRR
jgi:ribosomal protein S18 acetylase RimI-like enzyme